MTSERNERRVIASMVRRPTMFERDFIKRLVEQLGQLVARLSRLRDEGKHDEALDEIDETLGRLVPARHDLVARLDAASAARMMRDRDTIKAYARLLAEQAESHVALGDARLATTRRERAIALLEEARKMTDGTDEELEAWLREIRSRAPSGSPSPSI